MNRKKGYLLILGCDWSFYSVSLSVLSRIVAEEIAQVPPLARWRTILDLRGFTMTMCEDLNERY